MRIATIPAVLTARLGLARGSYLVAPNSLQGSRRGPESEIDMAMDCHHPHRGEEERGPNSLVIWTLFPQHAPGPGR